MQDRGKERNTPKNPGRGTGGTKRRRIIPLSLLPLVVVAAGAVVYLNSLSGAFVFDDNHHIVKDETIRSLWPVGDILANRRPVVTLTLAINYAVGGLKVWSYHALNLAVHLFAALTLYGVVGRTLPRTNASEACIRAGPWLAVTVALIWVVHPLHTQSVTYVIQRGESLMGLFYLLTLYCVIRGVDSLRRRYWYTAAIIACALGMGSKAVMVTAPAMILLYDYVFISKSVRRALRLRWGLYVGLAVTWGILFASGVVQGVLNPSSSGRATVGFGFKGITPLEYLCTQPGVILHYLSLSLWPHGLCLDYGWPVARTARAIIGPVLLIGVPLICAVWALFRRTWVGFVGMWFFLILAPTSSFIPIKDPMYEHRMYLSLAGVVVLVVIGGYACVESLSRRIALGHSLKRRIGVIVVLAVVTALGHRTIRRNRDYHTPAATWSDVVAKRPDNARAYSNLGIALVDVGKMDEGVRAYREALRIKPEYAKAHYNLGIAFEMQDKLEEAIQSFRTALRHRPAFAEARNNLGIALADHGEIEKGIEAYREALRIKPDYAEACYNLGIALVDLGEIEKGIDAYREALRINPEYYKAYGNLGVAFHMQGKLDEAVLALRTALEMEPDYPEAQCNLGHALLEQGRIDDAIIAYRKAVRIKPDYYDAYNNLGVALAKQRKTDKAIEAFRAALRVSPDCAEAHCNLGHALWRQDKMDEAVKAYRAALKISPEYLDAAYNLARVLLKLGKIDEAIRSFRQVLRIRSDHHDAHNHLGVALAMQGRTDEAIQAFRAALRIKPEYADAHCNLGHALMNRDNVDGAVKEYREALRIQPDHAAARNALDAALGKT